MMKIFPHKFTVHEFCVEPYKHIHRITSGHAPCRRLDHTMHFPADQARLIFQQCTEITALGLSDVSQRHVYPEALIACSLNTGLRAQLASALHAAGHQTSLVHDEPLTIPLLTSVIVL